MKNNVRFFVQTNCHQSFCRAQLESARRTNFFNLQCLKRAFENFALGFFCCPKMFSFVWKLIERKLFSKYRFLYRFPRVRSVLKKLFKRMKYSRFPSERRMRMTYTHKFSFLTPRCGHAGRVFLIVAIGIRSIGSENIRLGFKVCLHNGHFGSDSEKVFWRGEQIQCQSTSVSKAPDGPTTVWRAAQWKQIRARGEAIDRQSDFKSIESNIFLFDLPVCGGKELKLLQEGSKVYKLIGPALIKQDLSEALKNVTERISFIEGKVWASKSQV